MTTKASPADFSSASDRLARAEIRARICRAARRRQFAGIGGAFAGNRHGKNPRGQRREYFANMPPVLVLKHAEDECDGGAEHCLGVMRPILGPSRGGARRSAPQSLAQNFCAGDVVRAVEQDLLAVRPLNQLQSSRPVDACQTLANCFVADGNLVLQDFNRCQRQCGVGFLMFAGQRQRSRLGCGSQAGRLRDIDHRRAFFPCQLLQSPPAPPDHLSR